MAPQLFQSAGLEDQWRAVVLPWLEARAPAAWRDPRPTVVLTPARPESFHLRARWLGQGRALFGLRFWTPSDLRSFLLGASPGLPQPASSAELRLAARAAAENLPTPSPEEEPSLRSVAREPNPFLNAGDLLLGAGWLPARDGPPYGRRLAADFDRRLASANLATQADLHRRLRDQPPRALLAHVLILGFNATHWPLWDLLQAAVRQSDTATISLLSPRPFASEVDQLWIGSWQEVLNLPAEIPSLPDEATPAPSPFSAWIASYEAGTAAALNKENLSFIATREVTAQVDAIVLKTLGWLRDPAGGRLGLVFPEAGAVSLGVAERLREVGVPLDDGTGYWQPGASERRAWPAWLALQEEPSVARLTAWVRACEAENIAFGPGEGNLSARTVADVLDAALGETLTDDLACLRLYLEQNATRSRGRAVAALLRDLVLLPEKTTVADFLALTRRALEAGAWNESLSRLDPGTPGWLRNCRWSISRRAFLGWLRDATDTREKTRGPESDHFYGKVHLVIYPQLPGQSWTHLLLTGLNEGRWPRVYDAGAFGSRHELAALNRQARTLNRRIVSQGGQGEGHEVVLPGHGYCLLPLERQELALRDLCAAVESTSVAVCLAALTQEQGRALLPSDFFVQAWQAKTGQPLDEAALRALARRMEEACAKRRALLSPVARATTTTPVPPVAQTRVAFAARRSDRPFGRYEFAFAAPPAQPIQLPCKAWEEAWIHPAQAWLRHVVGVEAWPEGQLAWPRAVGTWVHRWLAAALRRFSEAGSTATLPALLRSTAEQHQVRMQALAEEAGLPLYPWWQHVWAQARAIALGLGESLAPALQDRRLLAEFRLPPDLQTALPGSDHADFSLRGQIDLLLLQSGPDSVPTPPDFTGCACWIVDFKTGSASRLKDKTVEKGAGLQAILYGLAIRQLGGEGIELSIQTVGAPLEPQLRLEQALAAPSLYRSLDRLHREGIFGQRPHARNEYGYAPGYPMATRAIDAEILQAKWNLVHGEAGAAAEEA